MNIMIHTIKIYAISNIGSLNIGKTIISRNNASSTVQGAETELADGMPPHGGLPKPVSPALQAPIRPHLPQQIINPVSPSS